MALAREIDAALDEVTYLRAECLRLIQDAMSVCPPDANGDYPDPFRTVTTPFLYAVWERCFTTNFGIMIKLLRHRSGTPSAMTIQQESLWLKSEPFFQSLSEKLRGQAAGSENADPKKAIKGSTYRVLSSFVTSYLLWRETPISHAIDSSKLVMTFSNVNCEVLDVNAEAIGLTDVDEFGIFRRKVGRLDDLVGRRNDIGHGTLARPPKNREFRELLDLVNNTLIKEFCDVVQIWIIYR